MSRKDITLPDAAEQRRMMPAKDAPQAAHDAYIHWAGYASMVYDELPDDSDRAAVDARYNASMGMGQGVYVLRAAPIGEHKTVPVAHLEPAVALDLIALDMRDSGMLASDRRADAHANYGQRLRDDGYMPLLPAPGHDGAYLADDVHAIERTPAPDGLLSRLLAYGKMAAPAAPDAFHLAGSLWTLSTIVGRRAAAVAPWNSTIHPALYVVQLALTSIARKSTAQRAYKELLMSVGDDFDHNRFIQSVTSPERMVTLLRPDRPLPHNWDNLPADEQQRRLERRSYANMRPYIADEYGDALETALSSGARSSAKMMQSMLLKFHDSVEYSEGQSTHTRGEEPVKRPFISLYGNATPANLEMIAAAGSAPWRNGIMARLLLAYAETTDLPPIRQTYADYNALRAAMVEIAGELGAIHRRLPYQSVTVERLPVGDGEETVPRAVCDWAEPLQIGITPQARAAIVEYSTALDYATRAAQKAEGGGDWELAGFYTRLADASIRIAILLAVADGSDRITLDIWAQAQHLGEQFRRLYHRAADSVMSGSMKVKNHSAKSKALRLIQNNWDKHGKPTSHSVLRRRLKLDDVALSELMADLCADGSAGKVPLVARKEYNAGYSYMPYTAWVGAGSLNS